MCLSFSQPIPGTGPNGGAPVSPSSGCYQAWIYTSCNHPNYNNSFLTLPAGQTMTCPLNVRFAANNKTYNWHMNPYGAFPQTNNVNVSCIFPTSGANPCSQWLVRPSASYVGSDGTTRLGNVANLSYQITSKGHTTDVNQGDFRVSFSILVIKP
jgi:hypothetical protein